MKPLVDVREAVVEFAVEKGKVRALDGVSLTVEPGETLAVVGESGCGKTTLARVILGLQPLVSGEVHLGDRRVQGVALGQSGQVGMVWQDPFASLDPRWTIGRLIEEPLRLAGRKRDLGELLQDVGLDPSHAERFPHQLSGGQRQRAAIARAIALEPPLVICDEPTAALDLSIQAQILNLLKDLQVRNGCAFLYISHDLQTVRFLANRVAVMYLGQIVEHGPTADVFGTPRHPYTRALLDAVPSLTTFGHLAEGLTGELPDARHRPTGCRFAGRCLYTRTECSQASPPEVTLGSVRAKCLYPLGMAGSAAEEKNEWMPL